MRYGNLPKEFFHKKYLSLFANVDPIPVQTIQIEEQVAVNSKLLFTQKTWTTRIDSRFTKIKAFFKNRF